jgi:hypothetical protein
MEELLESVLAEFAAAAADSVLPRLLTQMDEENALLE